MEAVRSLLAPFQDLPSFLLPTAGDRKPDKGLGMRRPHRVAFMARPFSWQKIKERIFFFGGGGRRERKDSKGEARERRKGDGRRGKVRGGKKVRRNGEGKERGKRRKEGGRRGG